MERVCRAITTVVVAVALFSSGFLLAAWFYQNGGALVVAGKQIGPDIFEVTGSLVGRPDITTAEELVNSIETLRHNSPLSEVTENSYPLVLGDSLIELRLPPRLVTGFTTGR